MPLDLTALSQQVARLGDLARAQRPLEETRLATAIAVLRRHAASYERLATLAEGAPLRPAVPREPLDLRRALPSVPDAYTVVATDGSQVEPDRHGPVLCHLVNVGSALLQYGPAPRAALASRPTLGAEDKDIYLPVGNGEAVLIQGRLLGLRRQIAETTRLAEIAEASVGSGPVVGLQDGTLLLSSWGEGNLTFVWGKLLDEFLGCLSRLREMKVPLASYVSRPRSYDVANLLRLAASPDAGLEGEPTERPPAPEAESADLTRVQDRAIFEALPLAPGERSAVFRSSWATSVGKYGDHKIHFFYVNVGPEIARVEVPWWVASDPGSLDLVHAVVWDQCQRGQGYPRALIEAHEKAVITAGDRRVYEALIDQALIASGLKTAPSEKERSKRVRSL